MTTVLEPDTPCARAVMTALGPFCTVTAPDASTDASDVELELHSTVGGTAGAGPSYSSVATNGTVSFTKAVSTPVTVIFVTFESLGSAGSPHATRTAASIDTISNCLGIDDSQTVVDSQ